MRRICAFAVAVLGMLLFLRRPWRPRNPARRILYLGTGQIAQVFPRNGINLFLERECSDFNGFFEQLWNVHFPAGARGALDLTDRHHLVDFDLPARAERLGRAAIVLREIAFLAWLVPFARRNRISMLTATNPYLQGLNAAIAGWLLGIPFGVIITRDFDWDWSVLGKQAFPSVFPTRRVEKLVEHLVLSRAALVLADRQYYRDFAVRNGAAPRRTVATRVLADTAFDLPAPQSHVRERLGLADGPLLTYVGRLDADKRALDLVECLAGVRQRFPGSVLACAGAGALEQAMLERATELGVGDSLRLLGTVSLTDLPSLLAESDVVLAAHMGYTLVEAGLTGVPIVTYDYDYHPEVLRDGESGYLTPFADPRLLARAVCAALEDPADAVARGARARVLLQTEHSLAAVIPLYRQAYASVLGSPAS